MRERLFCRTRARGASVRDIATHAVHSRLDQAIHHGWQGSAVERVVERGAAELFRNCGLDAVAARKASHERLTLEGRDVGWPAPLSRTGQCRRSRNGSLLPVVAMAVGRRRLAKIRNAVFDPPPGIFSPRSEATVPGSDKATIAWPSFFSVAPVVVSPRNGALKLSSKASESAIAMARISPDTLVRFAKSGPARSTGSEVYLPVVYSIVMSAADRMETTIR